MCFASQGLWRSWGEERSVSTASTGQARETNQTGPSDKCHLFNQKDFWPSFQLVFCESYVETSYLPRHDQLERGGTAQAVSTGRHQPRSEPSSPRSDPAPLNKQLTQPPPLSSTGRPQLPGTAVGHQNRAAAPRPWRRLHLGGPAAPLAAGLCVQLQAMGIADGAKASPALQRRQKAALAAGVPFLRALRTWLPTAQFCPREATGPALASRPLSAPHQPLSSCHRDTSYHSNHPSHTAPSQGTLLPQEGSCTLLHTTAVTGQEKLCIQKMAISCTNRQCTALRYSLNSQQGFV